MKTIISLLYFSWMSLVLQAQGESNIWLFGQNNALNFSLIPQQLGGIPGWGNPQNPNGFFRGNAACNAAGQLQFYVLMDVFTTSSVTTMNNVPNIYHANGEPMANGNLLLTTPVYGPVQIAKKPGNNKVYYVIYSLNAGLFYTAVDMALNGGSGAVVSSQKSIMLSGWNSIVGEKTALLKGCDGLWLVVRSKTSNQYKSYSITENGFNPVPEISNCGNYSIDDYHESSMCAQGGYTLSLAGKKGGMSGLLKSSPDSKTIVACTNAGLELYDFNRCNGMLSNARIIDTTGLYATPFLGIGGYSSPMCKSSYYSACFSPDGSKLYATYMFGRHVYQFDLSLQAPAAIMASKTAVLKNRPLKFVEIIYCTGVDTTGMGDLKLAPDGKIYIGNNSGKSCTADTAFTQQSTLHVIHNPDFPGIACNPELDAVIVPSHTSVDFNPDIAIATSMRDTFHSYVAQTVCLGDSLKAGAPGLCYLWNTGSESPLIALDSSGLYIVQWSGSDCSLHIDSFQVTVPLMPEVQGQYFGCPGEISIQAVQHVGDTTTYSYELNYGPGETQHAVSNTGHQFTGLEAGDYKLEITNGSGCDTVIDVSLIAYPIPNLVVTPEDSTIRYGDSIRINANGALLYVWFPSGPLDTATLSAPMARPLKPQVFTVVGINEYGCRDTGFVDINIDYRMPDHLPNAFSPNGDGINDMFRIQGLSYQKIAVFKIFNRYGQEVFGTTDETRGWDGSFNGIPCEMGTYYYLVILLLPDGSQRQYKGDLTLMR
jgi:gliding motility-associated-like protein